MEFNSFLPDNFDNLSNKNKRKRLEELLEELDSSKEDEVKRKLIESLLEHY